MFETTISLQKNEKQEKKRRKIVLIFLFRFFFSFFGRGGVFALSVLENGLNLTPSWFLFFEMIHLHLFFPSFRSTTILIDTILDAVLQSGHKV